MPLTPEQIEDRLKALEDENRALRRAKRNLNPFESLEFQLELENGHTVSARTRRMQMTCTQLPDATDARARFADGSSKFALYGVRIPSDWVVGTDLTVNLPIKAGGTGNMRFGSEISAHSDGETETAGNIEDVSAQTEAVGANVIETLSRTITGSAVSSDEQIRWTFQRNGGSAFDTVNSVVDAFYGAYLEYTAFF